MRKASQNQWTADRAGKHSRPEVTGEKNELVHQPAQRERAGRKVWIQVSVL